jgi:hypothetical protein
MFFVTMTTTSAAVVMVKRYVQLIGSDLTAQGMTAAVISNGLSAALIVGIVLCAVVVLGGAFARLRRA